MSKGDRKGVIEAEVDCLKKKYVTCTLQQILLAWSNKKDTDRVRHVTWTVATRMNQTTRKTYVKETVILKWTLQNFRVETVLDWLDKECVFVKALTKLRDNRRCNNFLPDV